MRRGLFGVLLALALALVLAYLITALLRPGGAPLELVVLDVGQGSAAVIRTPEGRTAIVDGGRRADDALDALDALGVRSLDLVVASHADADHIGGLVRVVEELRPAYFLDNGLPHTTRTYDRLMDAVEGSGAVYLDAEPRTLTLGSATLEVLPPPHDDDEQNDNSVGVLLRYGAFTALIPGDATAAEQATWLEAYGRDLDVDVYVAAHHGSSTGDRPGFVAALSPALVVISLGEDNPYGHPHREAMAAYAEVGAEVLRTDLDGPVTVSVPDAGNGGWVVDTGTLYGPWTADPLEAFKLRLRALLGL